MKRKILIVVVTVLLLASGAGSAAPGDTIEYCSSSCEAEDLEYVPWGDGYWVMSGEGSVQLGLYSKNGTLLDSETTFDRFHDIWVNNETEEIFVGRGSGNQVRVYSIVNDDLNLVDSYTGAHSGSSNEVTAVVGDSNSIYLTDTQNELTKIDRSSGSTETTSIPQGRTEINAKLDETGDIEYILNANGDSVQVYDTDLNQVWQNTSIGTTDAALESPDATSRNPKTGNIWLVDGSTLYELEVSTDTVVSSHSVSGGQNIQWSHDGEYLTNLGPSNGNIYVYNSSIVEVDNRSISLSGASDARSSGLTYLGQTPIAVYQYADSGSESIGEWRIIEVDVTPHVDAPFDVSVDTFMTQGTEQTYEVTLDNGDITDQASVTSGDSGLIVVDEGDNTLTSSGSNTGTVTVTFEHEGLTEEVDIFVGAPTIENLKELPSTWRVNAIVGGGLGGPNDGDGPGGGAQFQFIMFAILSGVLAANYSTSFAGLGTTQMVIVLGWFAGWVTTGLMLASLFFAMFVGFNLAANIDYQVRR